ncbi:MAG: hypothetical protein WC867_05675 [Candidatus Pacearchaeota archaeon]|jgi:hypothetical protein
MEKFYKKYAWIIFFLIGLVVLVGAVPHALGFNTDPKLVESISGLTIEELKISNPMFFNLYNFYFSGGGLSDLGFAFFIIVISLTAYRKGEKWAWYAFLFIPVYFLAWIFLNRTLPIEAQKSLLPPLTIIIILTILGLILPFRKFFPKK